MSFKEIKLKAYVILNHFFPLITWCFRVCLSRKWKEIFMYMYKLNQPDINEYYATELLYLFLKFFKILLHNYWYINFWLCWENILKLSEHVIKIQYRYIYLLNFDTVYRVYFTLCFIFAPFHLQMTARSSWIRIAKVVFKER